MDFLFAARGFDMAPRKKETGVVPSTQLLDEALSRRDFGKYAAIVAGLAGIAPDAVAAAGVPATSPTLLGAAFQDVLIGGSVTVARAGDSDSLDPAHTTAGISFQVFNNIYDTLIGFNMELTYEGILAESWAISEDGLEYTFHLRSGITFHDGTEFNADAVKFTFDRMIDPATNAPAAGWIGALQSTEVVDPQTVKLILSEPFSPLLGNLCLSYFGIVSPAAVEKFGDEYDKNPVGTGPWKFKEWVAGEHITLERNGNYQNVHSYMDNKGAPYLDELIFTNIPEDATQVAAFETGEVQIIKLPPREVKRFQEDSDYLVSIPQRNTGITYLEFAMVKPAEGEFGVELKPPFDDIRLRQAVGYAINADEVIESVLYGLAARNYGLMPTGMFAYNPDIEQFGFHFDSEKAKALLDEAGWTDPGDGVREKDGEKLDLVFWTWVDGPNEKVAQVFQNQLAQVGIKMNIEMLEVATFLARLGEGAHNLDMMGWGWPEPHLLKMMVEAEFSLGFYKDEQYLDLVDQASRTSDLTERTNLYFDASKRALEQAVCIPLWTGLEATGVRGEAQGYEPGPQGYRSYEDMYIED